MQDYLVFRLFFESKLRALVRALIVFLDVVLIKLIKSAAFVGLPLLVKALHLLPEYVMILLLEDPIRIRIILAFISLRLKSLCEDTILLLKGQLRVLA